MSDENTTISTVSFASILFFIFLTLKLTNYIHWSWWFVTMPLWLPALIGVSGFILIIIFKMI